MCFDLVNHGGGNVSYLCWGGAQVHAVGSGLTAPNTRGYQRRISPSSTKKTRLSADFCFFYEQMATPEIQNGGVSVMAAAPVDQTGRTAATLRLSSPIRIFLFFHKAIRAELDGLHRTALALATNGSGGDIKQLMKKCHFLRSIYKHHCNAEDEVCAEFIFSALMFTASPNWMIIMLILVDRVVHLVGMSITQLYKAFRMKISGI